MYEKEKNASVSTKTKPQIKNTFASMTFRTPPKRIKSKKPTLHQTKTTQQA